MTTMRLFVIFGLIFVTAWKPICVQASAADGNAKLIAAVESAPPPYIAWNGKIIPPEKTLGFWMDKEQYDTLDAVGGAYVVLRTAGIEKLTNFSLGLVLEGTAEGGLRAEAIPFKLPAPEARKTEAPAGLFGLALDINLQVIPVSTNARLTVVLRDGDKEVERVAWPFRKVARAAPPRNKVAVPFSVINPNPETDVTEPVFVGIPLPKGALNDPSTARVLDAAGKEVAAQIDAGTRWNRQGSIRWLGVRFIASHLKGVPATAYSLEYGTEVKSNPVTNPLRLTEAEKTIDIVTGPLRFIVPMTNGQVIQTVFLDNNGDGAFTENEIVAQAGSAGGPYLVDDTGKRYAAVLDAKPEIVVEERGPIRAVVRIESWYAAEDGKRLCKQITRLRAYRGLPRIDLTHSWLMTAKSPEARFADIGFALDVPDAQRMAFAGEPDQLIFTDIPSPSNVRYLLQDQWNHYGIHINFREVHFADPKKRVFPRMRMVAEGYHSEGWGALANPRVGLAVGCEDFWQNYPKEVSVSSNCIAFHVWPAHNEDQKRPIRGDELNQMYWLHGARLLNFLVPPEVVDFPEKTEAGTKYFLKYGARADAMGIMKTHEVKLFFFPAKMDNRILRGQMRAVLQTPVVMVDPKAMVGSGVFGPVSPRDLERYPQEEKALDRSVLAEAKLEEMNRTYGMFIFGDGYSGYDFTEQRFDLYRNFRSMHHGCNRTPWLLFFRSGDPFYFLRGVRNARQIMDRGLCHYVQQKPISGEFNGYNTKTVGGQHDYKGYVPWSAGARCGDYNSMTDFMFYYAHFVGDPQGRAVALEWWQGVLDWVGPGGSSRGQAGTFVAALDLYQDTWDRRMIPFLHAEYAGLCTGQNQEFGYFDEWQNYAPWLENYWYFTGSEAARKVLLKWAAAFVMGYGDISSRWGPGGLNILAAASNVSGDEKYVRRLNWLLYINLLSAASDPNSVYYGILPSGGGFNSLNNYFQQQLPYVLEARNRIGKDVGRGEGCFAIHPVKKDAKSGFVREWLVLDEKDEPIPMIFRVAIMDTSFHLTIEAPDGKIAVERDVPYPQLFPHGTTANLPVLRYELPPDGKRGVYRCRITNSNTAFAVTAPISEKAKEVYPVKDGIIGVRDGRAAFVLPPNTGSYTIEVSSKGYAFPLYVLDEKGTILREGRVERHLDGKTQIGFPFSVDSAVHQRLYVMACGDAGTFTITGKSPPRYCAVSMERLFDPETKGGAQ